MKAQAESKGQNGDNWIVKSGVQIGDKIVTDGLQKVTPGAPINAVSKEEMAQIKKKTLSAQQEKKKAWFSFTKKDNDENGEN